MRRLRSNRIITAISLAVGLCLVFLAQAPPEEAGKPQGPYVGQTPPGATPVVFAPGYVSTASGFEFSCSFSPDGTECYFNRGADILVTKWKSKGWSKPKRAPFNTTYLDHEAHVTLDGSKLFFGSERPQPGSNQPRYGLWVMDRAGSKWGDPRYHGPGMYVTTAANGNLYLTIRTPDGSGDQIGVQRFVDGQYLPPEPLGDGVNGVLPNAHPCIAADESFLIFDSRRPGAMGGEGDDDHYISFRNPDGSWGEAQHFDEISSTEFNMCASLSPDGKYIFFYRDSDIWWVSAEIIERYRPSQN